MAHPQEKVEAAVGMLKAQGHVVEILRGEKGTWYEVDHRMRASWEEMQNLADGVYSLTELEELFIRRQIEEVSPDELSQRILAEWHSYFEVGHADSLAPEFRELKDRAFEYLNAKGERGQPPQEPSTCQATHRRARPRPRCLSSTSRLLRACGV